MYVLIVDDDDVSVAIVEGILAQMGYKSRVARNGREALQMLRNEPTHLVITDWEMPEMNGIELCEAIRREDFNGYVYIIMITGRDGDEQKIQGLHAGADNFITKPLNPAELLVCLKTAERILALETRDLAIFALAKLAESRDNETGAHIERVQAYTRILAEQLATTEKYASVIDGEYIRLIHQTSPLHDIGKVGIPDAILLKPGKLDDRELAIMRTHAELGARTLDAALERFPSAKFLQMARAIAATHHEKFDGSGYPAGLAGEQIPLSGRIVALADVYDALTSKRVYKPAMSHQQARGIIISESSRHFDPDVVAAFLTREAEFIRVRESLADPEITVEPPPAPAPVLSPAPAAGETILVVDDDQSQLQFTQDILSSAGYRVLTAPGGQQAQAMIKAHQPAVVISDLVMPGLDGMALCKSLRQTESEHYTVFVMMTMHADKQHMIDAFDIGVDDFVVKPVDASELLARVRAGVRTVRLHEELNRRTRSSAQLNAQLARLNANLQRMAITDDLTGLWNRRQAIAKLEEQMALAERYGGPVSVAMLDLDFFKRINDTYGHDAGDEVLRNVAAILRASVRETDTVARVGGEEFLVILPAQTTQESAVSAQRCRQAIAAHAYNFDGKPVTITASFGIACRRPGMTDAAELVKEADKALYAAKHAGRNRVVISDHTHAEKQPT